MDEIQEIQDLRRELEQANYEYYVLDNPAMSDYDFDHKLRRLEELEAAPHMTKPAARAVYLYYHPEEAEEKTDLDKET